MVQVAIAHAAQRGHEEVCKVLLDHQADPNVAENFFWLYPADGSGPERSSPHLRYAH